MNQKTLYQLELFHSRQSFSAGVAGAKKGELLKLPASIPADHQPFRLERIPLTRL